MLELCNARGSSRDKLLNTGWGESFNRGSPPKRPLDTSKNTKGPEKIDIFQKLTDNFLQKKIKSRSTAKDDGNY